jgi:hypothetical protein
VALAGDLARGVADRFAEKFFSDLDLGSEHQAHIEQPLVPSEAGVRW